MEYRLESWVDHEPAQPYDAVTCIEMSEHLASDTLAADDKKAPGSSSCAAVRTR